MSSINEEKFCLGWNDFEKNIISSFKDIKDDEDFLDVTIACDGNQIKAHKVILSACSPFFRTVLKRNPHQHPLLYLKGVKHEHLVLVLNFMYHGEVNVAQDELNSFLAVSEDLQVKGLTQSESSHSQSENTREFKSHDTTQKDKPLHNSPTPNLDRRMKYQKPRPHGQPHSNSQIEKFTDRKDIYEVQQIKTENFGELQSPDNAEVASQQLVEAATDYQEESYEYDQTYHVEDQSYMMQEQDLNQGWNEDQLQYPCEYCEKVFRNKRSYYNHVNKHKGKTYCHLCSKTLSTVSNLKAHLSQVHQQEMIQD